MSQHTLATSLERIQALRAELRQTEALETQVHEMVLLKRQRLDTLLTEFVELANLGAPVEAPVAAIVEEPAPVPAANAKDLPLSSHGSYGAPKDLLQGRPAPSAQHVLDNLNRLMAGIRESVPKQASAA